MSTIFFIIISIFFFFILPLVFLFLTVKDFSLSSKTGKEMHLMFSGISKLLNDLHVVDIAKFDSEFSNWLEATMPTLRTSTAKSSVRLLIQSKYVGFGEGHREKLIRNEKYRHEALKFTRSLAAAYNYGSVTEIYSCLGRLYELFMCDAERVSAQKTSSQKHISTTSNSLEKAAALIENDFLFGYLSASEELKKGLHSIVANSFNEKNIGFSILLFQWAIIKVSKKQNATKSFLFPQSDPAAIMLQKVSKHYRKQDLEGTVHVISRSF